MDNELYVQYVPEKETELVDHYFKTIVSFSHLLGSLSGIVVDYITSAFGDKYIKAIWNSLEEPFAQRSASFKDFMNKPRPLLLVNPKFDPSDESEFRPLSEFDNEIANDPNMEIKFGLRNSIRLLDKKNFQLYFRPRRYKMEFSLSFVFDSDMQRIQAQQYIRQTIRHKLPITLHRYIENYIPSEYIKAIAKMNGYDIGSDELLRFLNIDSGCPIRYRYRTGSGNMEYFATIKTPLQILLRDGPSSNGPTKKGNIVVQSSFSESIELEFTAPSIYFLRTNSDIGKNLIENSTLDDTLTVVDKVNTVSVDNVFTLQIPIGQDIIGDFARYRQINIQADSNGDDTFNLKELINDSDVLSMIDYYEKNGLENDFVAAFVYEGINQVEPSRLIMNKSTLDFTIKSVTMYKSYYVNIYINRLIINTFKDSIFKTEGKKI